MNFTRGQKWKMAPFMLAHGRQWCGDAGSHKSVVSQMATVCLSSVWLPSPLTKSVVLADQWNRLWTLWDRAKCRHGQVTGLGLKSTLKVHLALNSLELCSTNWPLFFCRATQKQCISCLLIRLWLIRWLPLSGLSHVNWCFSVFSN